MSDFKIQVDQLEEEATSYRFRVPAAWWADRLAASEDTRAESEQVSESGFSFEIEASRRADDVLLAGRLDAELELECSRCAKRYSHALRDTFRLALEPAKGREPTDREGAEGLAKNGVWLGVDLEAGWFRGPFIRLDDFFGELIATAMPLQPLCDEACPGICPHCGADFAKTSCECVDERIDSPFAVLAKLSSEMREN